MSGYLVDTSFISILAPSRAEFTPELENWVRTNQDNLYLSVITIFEIEQGIHKLTRKNAVAKAKLYSAWLNDLEAAMDENILAVTRDIARRAASILSETIAGGWQIGYPDIMIGATAVVADLPVLTRNMKHFNAMNIRCIDPVEALP
jgi:toxin FitB